MLVTGSLVAREEVLVGPEVEGLRVTEVLADEGTRVKKGDVLVRLVSDTLEAQLAQNDAALARAQVRSGIVPAEARLLEANNAFERAKPLCVAGHLAESTYDQREQAARIAEAQLRRIARYALSQHRRADCAGAHNPGGGCAIGARGSDDQKKSRMPSPG